MTGKILVVDDDPHILYLLRIILKTEGFAVLTCQDEREALDLVKKEFPNLVILDILMPKINGWEICKTVRETPEIREIPILIMSSLPFKEKERALARELNVYDYVTKPFEPIFLLGKVKSLFQVPQPLRHLVKESPQAGSQVRRGVNTRRVETLVVGGGIAGIAAAEAAARGGSQVMLLALWPFLAEELMALHQVLWFAETHHQEEEKFFQLLKKGRGARHSLKLNAYVVEPEAARKAAYSLLTEYHIPFMLNVKLLDVLRDGTTIKGIVIEGEGGTERIEAKTIVDATIEGMVLELAGIPVVEERIEPEANVLLGGVEGEIIEKSKQEFSIHPLPSMREAILLNVQLGIDWIPSFYESIEETVVNLRKEVSGCENAYILRRPLAILTSKKAPPVERYPIYGPVIPKTFDSILISGWPMLGGENLKDLGFLYFFGKVAGTLAGLSAAYNQGFREIPPEVVRDMLKSEGVLPG